MNTSKTYLAAGMAVLAVLATSGTALGVVVDYVVEMGDDNSANANPPPANTLYGNHTLTNATRSGTWFYTSAHSNPNVAGFPTRITCSSVPACPNRTDDDLTTGIGGKFSTQTTSSATFSFTPVETGTYEVYATWGQSSTGDSSVQYTLNYEGGSVTSNFNQRNVGQHEWHQIGTMAYPMNAGVTYTVVATNAVMEPAGTNRLMADAVLFRNPNAVCTGVPTVSVRTPVLTGDTTVTVTGVDPAATVVKVYANGLNVSNPPTGTPTGGATTVIATTTSLPANANINATQTIGGAEGCALKDGPQTNNCNQIGGVTIGGVLVAGDTSVPVSGVDPQATAVKVYQNGTLIGTNNSPGGASTVNVSVAPNSLTADATVAAIQEIRGLAPCTVPPTDGAVVGACGQVPAVSVVGLVDAGRTVVRVSGVSASATGVTVYANDAPIVTNAPATAGTTLVTVPALVEGQIIKATQTIRIPGCLPTAGRRVMAANLIEDFGDLTTNLTDGVYPKITGNPPASGATNRVWYNAGDSGFMATTPTISTLFGSQCIRFADNGFGNGMYAVYEQVIPSTGTYHLQIDMLIDEVGAGDLDWLSNFQAGVIVNGAHRTPGGQIAACSLIGNYTGPLTVDLDGATATQAVVVLTSSFTANAGDNLLIAFATNVGTYTQGGGAPTSPFPGMKIDNIKLNSGARPCLASDVKSVSIPGPVEAGATQLQVSGVSQNPAASLVSVYRYTPSPDTWTLLGTVARGGAPDVSVPLTTALETGWTVVATQTYMPAVAECTAEMEGEKHFTGPIVGLGKNSPLRVTLGVRENTALTGPIGADGGIATSTIQWVGATGSSGANAPVGKLIAPSGEWQTVTFWAEGRGGTDPVLSFNAGDTTLNGAFGILEHLAFTPTAENTGRYKVYIDNVMNGATVVANFEGLEADSVALFRVPSHSGTTAPFLLTQPNVSAVDTGVADGAGQSLRVEWQFNSLAANRWLRLTTFDDANSADMPHSNPQIDLSQPVSVRLLLVGCGLPSADFDLDGDVDMDDFGEFQACFKPSGAPSSACFCSDLNSDNVVNLQDFAEFLECATGPNVPFVPAEHPQCTE